MEVSGNQKRGIEHSGMSEHHGNQNCSVFGKLKAITYYFKADQEYMPGGPGIVKSF